MTRPFGIPPDDLAKVMATFGVAEVQVRRDHAISHILAALSRHRRQELIFFGGTALSRTYLLDERLSEDIDLIAVDQRDGLADELLKDINAALVRTHGRITWSPGWSRNSDVDPAVAVMPDGIAIKIQLLRGTRYEPWPTKTREIEQRYRDAPPAILRVPTLLSFAGWKTAAWMDRGAARDLYDLWAVDKVGALNAESAALFATHGPTSSPAPVMDVQACAVVGGMAGAARRADPTHGVRSRCVGGRAHRVGSSGRRGRRRATNRHLKLVGHATQVPVRSGRGSIPGAPAGNCLTR